MQKKKWYVGAVAALVLALLSAGVYAEANGHLFLGQFTKTRIEVNGSMLKEEDVPPFIVNGRTVLPVAQVAEMLNALTSWDESRRVVVITKPIVNMAIINRNRNEIEVNPSFRTGNHSFQVATQVSKVPTSKNLKMRFVVTDSSNRTVHEGKAFTIDTERVNGSFQGNLEVAGLRLSSTGEYVLKLEMEDGNKFVTIGEYLITVR
ncbi:stalk domain-containing protein [Caldalkalibacillus mannanilyticus]|uniref:stalk domain-containing protein n=1 Tax=Caldalkalibacillus mannanilyticus TaxID=1418 RepID=UPI0004682475|nr:stalk domain-containing protein [Caldalkalibacillus mannanilyticus]